ncbi:MAG: DUF5110 domain-containing protein [Anaerolineales bacterium]|nr:DUF5110 domain-containing protein [Anaerolineales bacterium]
MPILTYAVSATALTLQTDQGYLEVAPHTPQTVRVRYRGTPDFNPDPGPIVCAPPDPTATFTVRELPDRLLFATDALIIAIDRRTAAFTYLDRQGCVLTREPARGGKTLEPIEVRVSVFDDADVVESRENVDGLRMEVRSAREVLDRHAYHTKLEFEWAPDEALYGLGSHEEGMFNLRGQHQYLYQQNMKAVVPVLVSTRGYGVFLNSCSLMTFHDDAFGSYLWSDVDDELDFFFIVGPEFDTIVAELRRLTGAAPMLPRWAFGYIQSKERYVSQAELLEVVREYRRRGLPLDCIVLDWKSWTGELWGQKTLDPVRFPDPDRLTADLHALSARMMISIWPIMRPGGDNWREFKAQGLLLGNQANYDAFKPEARACYWKQTNEGLFAHGIDAWWCDCTEPFESDWKGAIKPEPEERLRINVGEARRYLDPELINAYSLLHSEGIYIGQRQVSAAKRVVNLTRSAYLGQQRYATITWSGDVAATWDTLRRQIADGLNFCLTGVPYWTTDIGAFFVQNKPELWFWSGDYDAGVADWGYRELYVRWFQYAAFLPMFRAHGTDTPREIWRFGEPGEPMYDTLVTFLQLRYRLLPYIYALAGWTTHKAYTPLRALPFDFRGDSATHAVGDQFMFGPAFLVCPVTQPMYYNAGSSLITAGARTRPVYLPAGTDWVDFWTDRRHTGGQTIEAEAPLERLPLYVRVGAIVPMGPARQHVDDLPDAPLEVHVYPGADGHFDLYDDAGDGYAYEEGAFTTVGLTWDEARQTLTLGARAGGYDGMRPDQDIHVIVHDPTGLRERYATYRGEALTLGF